MNGHGEIVLKLNGIKVSFSTNCIYYYLLENVVEFIKNIYKNNFTPEIKRQILRASELKNTGVKIDGGR